MTSSPSGIGSSQSRLSRLVIMPTDDLYKDFQQYIGQWRKSHYSMMMLEQQLLMLTLRGTGNQMELGLAWERAYTLDLNNRPAPTALMMQFARALYERFAMIWRNPPYNDDSLIIYGANVQSYLDDSIIIEVQYRHALPTPQP
jgi:hypothetical protein